MAVLSGRQLWCLNNSNYGAFIHPFHDKTVAFGMSYGVSYAGYDIRVRETMYIPSGEFRLASSIEQFKIPENVLGQVCDKSTWARQGLSVFNTIIEPGWEGFLTLELVNHGRRGIQLTKGMPIAQIIFNELDEPVRGYDGKYNKQDPRPVEAIFEEGT